MSRHSVYRIFFLLLLYLGASLALAADTGKQTATTKDTAIIIHAGTLLAVPGTPPASGQSLLIINSKIVQVREGYLSAQQLGQEPARTQIIDLRNAYVLPGLIDAHVHLLYNYGSKFRDTSITSEERLIAGVVNARATLEAGFTTVADLDAGAESWPVIVLRNAIEADDIPGPRLLVAGSSISATGGHGDYVDGPDAILEQIASSGLCDGEAECRRAVRRQFRQGADLIKLHASGGGNERTGGKDNAPSFMPDEFEAIVLTSHSLGMKVTAHAHATAGINAALEAGVDAIEHGSFLDRDSIRLFKKTGAYLVPTLDVQNMIADRIGSVPPAMQARMKQYQDEHPANVAIAWKAGVRLALGSDAGVVPHGSNAQELVWMVRIGISPAEAIRIGTIDTAKHLGVAGETGSLAAGMNADIIAVGRDPLQDIKALEKVMFVMKQGRVYKHGE